MAEAADEFFYVLAGVFVGRADHLWGEGGTSSSRYSLARVS